MRIPSELPEGIAGRPAFGSVEARRLGVTKARLAASDLMTPYRGSRLVRSEVDATLARLASAYATRMPASQFFSHSTAALLNDVPLPLHLETDRRLHVSVLAGGARPRVRGVIGHVLDPGRTGILESGGLRMTDAATTWCQLGALLDVDDLVAAGDFLITGREPIGGRRRAATIGLLADAVDRHRGTAGVGRLRMALPLLRFGPLSRRETLVRLRMLRAGLPEPRLNHEVHEARHDGYVPVVDLAYPEYRVAIEYEGDHHRERPQFRRDIRRYEFLQDCGWHMVRLSGDDVPDDADAPSAHAAIERIAARLRRRGWRG